VLDHVEEQLIRLSGEPSRIREIGRPHQEEQRAPRATAIGAVAARAQAEELPLGARGRRRRPLVVQ